MSTPGAGPLDPIRAAMAAGRPADVLQASQALLQDSEGGQPAAGDVDLEAVAGLLDEEDEDENAGYGQIMLSMTRNPRRQRPDLPS